MRCDGVRSPGVAVGRRAVSIDDVEDCEDDASGDSGAAASGGRFPRGVAGTMVWVEVVESEELEEEAEGVGEKERREDGEGACSDGGGRAGANAAVLRL